MTSIIMNLVTFLILASGVFTKAYGQKEKKNIDFVLMVNEEIYAQYNVFKFITIKGDKRETMPATYWPGNLSVSEDDYEKIQDSDSVFLDIIDTRYKRKSYSDQYIIKYRTQWLADTYNIVYIYNLNKKKYARLYAPSPQGNYVFELDSPGYTFRIIRKRG